MAARGERNNNPGNIEYDPNTKWQGLATPPTDGRFARFEAPKWGIRALARVLISYQDKHDLRTVRGIIARWAPSNENNVDAYVRHVCRLTGFSEYERLDMFKYEHSEPLVRAIIQHELGYAPPYSQAVVDEGLKLAGIVVPVRKGTENTVAATTGGSGVALTAGGQQVLEQAQKAGEAARPFLESTSWILVGLGVLLVVTGVVLAAKTLFRKKVEA